ncbi:hypothetical protein ACLSU7_11560 [Bdellovibrio sp. HCB185ZH]|uniref:hypothetical protein n=1 Tax=Bdellovibrio sp. HCB185ZH TaxID=3394235 RepID=UPI0039A415A7
MRTTFLLTFLVFFLSLTTSRAFALERIIFNPRETSITQRIISYKNYDDIRIDRDLDGRVDEWFVRKSNSQFHITYIMGKIDTFEFAKFENGDISIKKYKYVNRRLTLIKSELRPMYVMYGDPDEPCKRTNVTLENKISNLNQDISAILGKPQINAVPKSCNVSKFPTFAENLGSMGEILRTNSDKITSCLEKKSRIGELDLNLVSAKFKIILDKIADGDSKEIYSCEFNNAKDVKGVATEDGRIKFYLPVKSEDPIMEPDVMVNLFYHEMLHSSGIISEELNRGILDSCLNDKPISEKLASTHSFIANDINVDKSNNASAKSQKPNTKEDAKPVASSKRTNRGIAGATSKAGESLDMKSEIANAEKIIPSAEKLNIAKVDKSPAGKEQALRDSVQESAPVFRMANRAMGISNTPALADSSSSGPGSSSSPSYVSSDSETGSSSRKSSSSSSGQRYQSRYGRYQSKSNGGVGADEYVAEEIDLTKNAESQAKKAASPTRTQASRTGTYQPATTATNEQAPTNSRGPASVDPEVSGSGKRIGSASNGNAGGGSIATGSAGGSADLNISSSSGGGSGTQSAQNRTRSASSAGRSPASTNQQGSPAQRQEIMTTLTNNDYVLTKRKLKDPSFLNELEANNVKVVDGNGSSWGAKSGTTIYYDDGNRFIRQR